jgi:ATP/maltotriose-dependent transcriptional regulator MalT/DNA-binding SARP family transcriptional activator
MTSTPDAAEARRETEGRTVRRAGLAARVGDALDAGSVIITAGAGSGKTTILEQALERRTVAWLNCSATERAPGALFMRLIGAIAEAAPGASDAFAEQLARGLDPIDLTAATRELIAELSRLLIDPLVVAIDDGEQLDGASDSISLIESLIRAEVPTLHVALATRRALGLRVAKLRAAGRVTELTATDLAFDADECEALLRGRTGADPSPGDVDRMMEATEGWPLGIALASAMVERGGLAALGHLGSASDLRSYLSEELLDSLDPELHAAAVDLSVARVITPEVISALGHSDDVGRRLEAAGVALRWVDDRGSFAFHPLLRGFLLDELNQDRGRARGQHAAVAPTLAASGEVNEAIDHWMRAESWPEVVGAIERHGMALVRASPQLVAGWLEALPADSRALPTILTLQGQIEWLAGDNDSAIEHLRAAVEAFREHPNPRAEWFARSILTDCLFTAGSVDEFEPAMEGWEEAPADAGRLPTLVALFTAISLAAYGRFDRSEQLVERATADRDSGRPYPSEGLRSLFVDVPRGRLDEASEALHRGLADLKAFDPASRIQLRGALALVTAERGYPEEAMELWQEVQREGRVAAPALSDAGHGWCALLHAQAGRLEEAEAELAVYRGLEPGARSFVRGLAPASVAALRGDREGTLRGAETAKEIVGNGPMVFQSTVAAELAPALVAVGHPDDAVELIETTIAAVDRSLPGEWGNYPRARMHALGAWLAHLEADSDRADRELCLFLETGDTTRFVLRREWPRLKPLIWSALERGLLDAEQAVEMLSRAFPGGLEMVALLDHPEAAVRSAALTPAVRSGDPKAIAGLRKLTEDDDPKLAESATDALERLAASLPPLHVEVLGGFAVRRGSWLASESDWARPIDARLVRFLLVNADEPVPEDVIFEALWPDRPATGARRSLQVSVSRARQVLDPPGAEQSMIEGGERSYRLALGEGASVDADRFLAAADRALAGADSEPRPLLQRARSLWTGEPLPEERYSDWATSYREGLIDRYLAVLGALCDLHESAGEHFEASQVARELVDLDPLNERGHRALMTAYARTGRRGHALRQFLECRRALVDSLGIEPAAATSALQARILAGERI